MRAELTIAVLACSTGWLSWNGDPFPNTSYDKFIDYFNQVLKYNNGSGSINLYMAHGGTNFGWRTGGTLSFTTSVSVQPVLQAATCAYSRMHIG